MGEAFKTWDVDGNGTISQLELSCVLKNLDSSLTYDAIEKLFHAADTNHDGSISYEEFISWLFIGDTASSSGTNRGLVSQNFRPEQKRYLSEQPVRAQGVGPNCRSTTG